MACGILVPRPGLEPVPPAKEALGLNHWAAREVPVIHFKYSSVYRSIPNSLMLPTFLALVVKCLRAIPVIYLVCNSTRWAGLQDGYSSHFTFFKELFYLVQYIRQLINFLPGEANSVWCCILCSSGCGHILGLWIFELVNAFKPISCKGNHNWISTSIFYTHSSFHRIKQIIQLG